MNDRTTFWHGMTCRQLKGTKVRVTFRSGAVLTGVMEANGCIARERGDVFIQIGSDSELFGGRFTPDNSVGDLELADDPDYETIRDMTQVREGDIVHYPNGNRYRVLAVEGPALVIRLDYDGKQRVPACKFAYLMRERPRLPDSDGMWLDKDDRLWVCAAGLVRRLMGETERRYTATGELLNFNKDEDRKRLGLFAPFRPLGMGKEG